MPILRYTPTGFGRYMGAAFSGARLISFSWEELCRAAITVGRRSWADVLQFGTYSVLETIWRLTIVWANLKEEANSRIGRSNAFLGLDPSEKGAVSYFLGLAIAKLLAERLFGVAWLLHFDLYRQYLNPTLGPFGNKPDFVGLDATRHWVVIETKGRTNAAGQQLANAAKRQTRSLRQVGGEFPTLRAAIVVDFAYGPLRAFVQDPEEFDPDAPDITVEARELVRAYYRPLIRLIQNLPHDRREDSAKGQSYLRATLPVLDVTVELNEKIFQWYELPDAPLTELEPILPKSPEVLQHVAEHRGDSEKQAGVNDEPAKDEVLSVADLREEQPVGADGVSVILGKSWNKEIMCQEPEKREQ